MTGGRGRTNPGLERARLEMVAAAEDRRRTFRLARAAGCSVPKAARLAGVSERTGWRYAKTLAERSQAGR